MNKYENLKRYNVYLNRPEWKKIRDKIIERDNNKCVVCSSTKELQVHHKQYHFSNTARDFVKPWQYPERLLITICNNCHNIGHKKFKVPTKYIK